MPERVVLIGLGGIGSQLLPSLVRYLSFRPEPRPLLVLVDGDAYEISNRSRQLFPDDALGTNKAEALAQVFRGGGLAVAAIAAYVSPDNVGLVVREGDLCPPRGRQPPDAGARRPAHRRLCRT